jgi:hypothetical protein
MFTVVGIDLCRALAWASGPAAEKSGLRSDEPPAFSPNQAVTL